MQAVYYTQYGSADVLHYGEQPTPTPKADQILVRVRASSVNPIDWKVRQGEMKLLTCHRFPKIPGRDVAGEVAAVGDNVTRFQVGDRVYGMAADGVGGAAAEYAVLAETSAAFVPPLLSMEQAGAVPLAALTALQGLYHHGRLLSGDRVLINGASGGVGSFAVQIARALGAGEITGVCGPDNQELVRTLGADRVLNHKEQDFTADHSRYDVIFDAAGKSSFSASKNALRRLGRYVTTIPDPAGMVTGTFAAAFSDKSQAMFLAKNSGPDMALLSAWLQAGTLKPVIYKTFALRDLADAHRLSEKGGTPGKIVLTVE
ncbi:NAD(P)-dependent alcohol dehydrogenase [Microvirga sp. STR05]|uniref:NAD(P)-dependent alcohol dehydrogenase n=1 Tax=Hymenobacter duratus TaxID=2771356 RepID=A0ABR8JIT5_9BACT|nr:NAD(P)-dependent alcohol dehydrogenase [Hymenobacter duratus]MBD2715285.1 NAD(P)-dependent alcohol dehydrogenase [Hymenobacter duratus]MBR7950192.1 NAD(P)-dependent alcohol dehydrogenase [Microvirga sp. STR05]